MFNFFKNSHRFWGALRIIGALLISCRFLYNYFINNTQASIIPKTLISFTFFLFFLIIPLIIAFYHGIKEIKLNPIKQRLLLFIEFLFYIFYGSSLVYTSLIRILFLQHEYRQEIFVEIIFSAVLGVIYFVVIIRIVFEFFNFYKDKKSLKYIDILDSGKEFGQQ